jgi:hypothetical protein
MLGIADLGLGRLAQEFDGPQEIGLGAGGELQRARL